MRKKITVNEDLRVRMLKAGLTQKQVAEALGIRRDYLSRTMASERITDNFRNRILSAINQLEGTA